MESSHGIRNKKRPDEGWDIEGRDVNFNQMSPKKLAQKMEGERQTISAVLLRLYESSCDETLFAFDKFDADKFVGVELRTLERALATATQICSVARARKKAEKQRA